MLKAEGTFPVIAVKFLCLLAVEAVSTSWRAQEEWQGWLRASCAARPAADRRGHCRSCLVRCSPFIVRGPLLWFAAFMLGEGGDG